MRSGSEKDQMFTVGGGLTGRESSKNHFSSKRFEPNNSIADSHSHALSAINIEAKYTITNPVAKEPISEAYEATREGSKTKKMESFRRMNSSELNSRVGSQSDSLVKRELSEKNKVTEKKISFIQ